MTASEPTTKINVAVREAFPSSVPKRSMHSDRAGFSNRKMQWDLRKREQQQLSVGEPHSRLKPGDTLLSKQRLKQRDSRELCQKAAPVISLCRGLRQKDAKKASLGFETLTQNLKYIKSKR